jgi:molecular chaperone GrpE
MKSKRGTMTKDRDDEGAGPDHAAPGEANETKDVVRRDPEAVEAELNRLRAREEELLRGLAEMTNVQRRRKQETEQTVRFARESLIRELLPVLDDFERALAAVPGQPHDPLHAGVELVRDRMMKILEKEGLVPVPAAGQPFDPNLHDAIGERVAPPGIVPGVVLDVAQPGYLLYDRVLRHAKVVVAGTPAIDPTPSSMFGKDSPPDTIEPPLAERDRDVPDENQAGRAKDLLEEHRLGPETDRGERRA